MRKSTGLSCIPLIALMAQAREVPFPSALDAAAVAKDQLDDVKTRALPLGNGDMNALLWDRGGHICLRVTKNDLWDARIDTSGDPPLLKMDVRNRKWSGGAQKVPSWSNHPYPQPHCAAVVTVGSPDAKNPLVNARLDLRSPVATGPATARSSRKAGRSPG